MPISAGYDSVSLPAVLINVLAIGCLAVAFFRDRTRCLHALAIAARSFLKILPMALAVVVLVGLLLGFVPEGLISRTIGRGSGLIGILIAAAVGAVLYIPSIVAFPLAGSLVNHGASVGAVAAFITALTMVGLVTLSLEVELLGKGLALSRNAMSLVLAVAIALIMGLIL